MFIRKLLFSILLIFLLSGCIQYEETIHIFPSGWVRVSIDLRAPATIFRQMVARGGSKFFKLLMQPRHRVINQLPSSVQLMEWYLDKSTANWHFHTNFYVKSSSAGQLSGLFEGQKINISISNGNVNFRRFIDMTRFGRIIANLKQSPLIKRELLLASHFRFRIVVPTRIISTNATVTTEDTAEWDFKLLDLVAQPQVMKITFPLPPFYYYPLFWLLYGLVSMVFYLWLLFKKL